MVYIRDDPSGRHSELSLRTPAHMTDVQWRGARLLKKILDRVKGSS